MITAKLIHINFKIPISVISFGIRTRPRRRRTAAEGINSYVRAVLIGLLAEHVPIFGTGDFKPDIVVFRFVFPHRDQRSPQYQPDSRRRDCDLRNQKIKKILKMFFF